MIYLILSLKVLIFSIWIWRLPVQSQQLEHVWNMFTGNLNDTVTTPLFSFLILNSFHTLLFFLSSLLWTGSFLLGRMTSQTKPLKIKSFLPFNSSTTNICAAICLAEDRTRMGSIYFQLVKKNLICKEKSGTVTK